MSDPLQRSSTSTPDSATGWDAVDREIERLSHSSRASSRGGRLSKSESPPHGLDGGDDGSQGDDDELDELHSDSGHAQDARIAADLHASLRWRRILMLACACVLSVGSHFSTYTLGPIKKSLGTTESGFAGLISSFELLNTVTPLVSGFLVPKYGAAPCGLAATGAVLVGQVIVCFASSKEGGIGKHVGGMVLGLLVFGSGTSPLAVVQESIILRHNSSLSRFVARSVAAGLVLGKSASFAAGWSSERLYSISPRLPFIIAASLAAFSFSACILYVLLERSASRLVARSAAHTLPIDAGECSVEDKFAGDEHADRHRPIRLSGLVRFGSPFWWYIAVCALAGMWYTTQHLSSHLLQAVYSISQSEASSTASLLLGMPVLCYPLVGWLVDTHPGLLEKLWVAVPALTATSYFFLLLLSPVIPPFLALLPAAIGMGSGPLLLVLVVPRVVERHQAPTALGVHKSLEMAGAIIFQTLCGILISLGKSDSSGSGKDAADSADLALSGLLLAALVQLALVARWWSGVRQHGRAHAGSHVADATPTCNEASGDEAESELLAGASPRGVANPLQSGVDEGEEGFGQKDRIEVQNGRRALRAAAGTVLFSWVCFVWNVVRH